MGIDVGYGLSVEQAKQTIDKVSSYTNFFVLGNYGLSMNITQLNETLQYAYDKGMYFMSYPPPLYSRTLNITLEWLNYTREQWGNHLVGFLYPYEDEPGGHQLDMVSDQDRPVDVIQKTSYADAEQQFVNSTWFKYMNQTRSLVGYPLFTSDYALYWFDYKGGYDGVFAEFGWNYSRQINVALCRGAAPCRTKMGRNNHFHLHYPRTWSQGQTLRRLSLWYNNGAKYIIVLDTNENWTAGALQKNIQALQDFWQYATSHPTNYPVYEESRMFCQKAMIWLSSRQTQFGASGAQRNRGSKQHSVSLML